MTFATKDQFAAASAKMIAAAVESLRKAAILDADGFCMRDGVTWDYFKRSLDAALVVIHGAHREYCAKTGIDCAHPNPEFLLADAFAHLAMADEDAPDAYTPMGFLFLTFARWLCAFESDKDRIYSENNGRIDFGEDPAEAGEGEATLQ